MDATGRQSGQLNAKLTNVALSGLQTALGSPVPRDVALTGTANADVNAKWTNAPSNIVANSNVTLRGTVRQNGPSPAEAFPLNGEIHLTYNGAAEEIFFTRSFFRTPKTIVNLAGTVSETASLQVQLQSTDLREIEAIIGAFHPVQSLGLAGTGSLTGSVRG
jgi:hypothetical protein